MITKVKKKQIIKDKDEEDLIAFFTLNLFSKNNFKQDDYQEESPKLDTDDRCTTG